MRVWHMELYPCGDKRLPHHRFPPKMYTPDQLHSLTGVVSYKVDVDDTNALKKRISRVKAERDVAGSDMFTIHKGITDYEQILEDLYEPVTKNEDSIFLVMDGTAYYDVELEEDDWIRINVEKGDLIVIPKGRAHRFTVTPSNNALIQRFYPRKTVAG